MDIQAIIISVGTELTSGQVIDTNSAYLAQRLAELGIATVAHAVVDDHQQRIAATLIDAARKVPLVLVSGGLGPTADDLTRQALAEAMGVELVLDEPSLTAIDEFFRRRGREMGPTNRVQAMVPRGAEVLPNAVGTAPGIHARLGQAEVFVVPGVPSEMRHMAVEHILPRLRRRTGNARTVFRTVHTFGAGESDVAARIADLMARDANPLVGTTVAGGVVSVRVLARGASHEQAVGLAEQAVRAARERLGELVFGLDEQTLAAIVGAGLIRRGATMAVAESCTGGLLGQLITDVPGASACFRGGVIAYDNAVKRDLLDVPGPLLIEYGAVSEPVAAAMAEGARRRFDATYALAITGIAGPGGGTSDKPVGLVYTALAAPDGTDVRRSLLPGDRSIVRLRSALTALDMLRLRIRAVGQ